MKKRLTFLLRYYLTTVLLFITAKLVFMLVCKDGQTFVAADVFDVILHGLSLDLSTALYFLIVPFLVSTVSCFWQSSVLLWVIRVYTLLVSLAFALAFVADTSLYPFWQFKLDASCLQYLETPTEAMASVTPAYLVVRAVAILLVAVAVYGAYGAHKACRPYKSYGAYRPYSFHWSSFLLHLLLIPLIILGIRGGFGESTTNIGQVYYSQNQFLNHAAVNPVFSFLYSLNHRLDDLSQYAFYEQDECDALTLNVYTTESTDNDTLLNNRRPDILIILLESAGEQFATVMPRLQQLKKEGVYFSQCYANSWRTDRGTVATLSGYPSFPTVSVMKIPEKSRTLPSIARTLKQQGYATSFLYGGDINFTNMRSYLISTAWDRLTSMDDYPLEQQRSAQWGVRDDITFETMFQRISASQNDHQRHLWGFSTLSSHEPWDVPTATITNDEVLNAFAYLDNCLYNFINKLRQTPAWQNLLVVLIADHGIIHGDVDLTTPLRKNHIPMLWLGGAVRKPCTITTLCNQSDLAATLLGQLQLDHHNFSFSRDVLSSTYRYPTAVSNYSNAQWICDSTGHLLYDFDLRRTTISESRDADRLLRLNKAIIQTTTNDLQNR